jgi:hypothetical protein
MNMKMKITLICLAPLFLHLAAVSAYPQASSEIELTAQGIVARVDRMMEYPKGVMTGRMKHIRPDGSSYTVNLKGYITDEDFLFIFATRDRGEEMKVLYNLGGEEILVYNIHALKLFHKLGIDKYDPLLATNFSFIDLSGYDLQSNYTAAITGDAVVKNLDCYKLELKPIFRGGEYGLLTLYVSKADFIPLRIDFHDRDRAITKFLSIVKIEKRGGRMVPIRYDMMNIRQGTITILNFFSFEDNVRLSREMFRPEKLGE